MKNVKSGLLVIIMFSVTLLTSNILTAEKNANKKKSSKTEKKETQKKKETIPVLHYDITVTATRNKRETFETPKPVSVVGKQKIEESAPNNVAELLKELPGVDVTGVSVNQVRPIIRGLRGQRILLMEDGIRINNSRRQQDFGEISGMIDVSEVDRVEVVRGPASVLYGSDAIGGVINIITQFPEYDPKGYEFHGNFNYRYNTAGKQNKYSLHYRGHIKRLGFMFNGNMREASDYESPAGSFGDIKLIEPVTVNDTGVSDYGFNLQLNYNITNNRQASLKYAFYNAKNAGFGFVEPELFNPGTPRIQILYPLQKMQTYTLKYEDKKLDFFLADHLGITGYYRNNERELENNIFVPFNIPMMPQAGININSENFTDVETLGFRLELSKAMGKHMLTYGTDFFRDNSENTDIQKTQIKGAGPPQTDISTTPQVPNAIYQSFGIFCQNHITLISRTSLILGLRYQNVNARTKQTEGLEGKPILESTDQTFVGTANLIYGVTDQLRLVLSVGRGFRSPNLIERFFNGFTPDGSSYQSPNPGLKAETSLNVDAGFKYRLKGIYLESTRFSNIIYDGIRIDPTGIKIHGLPEYKNINVDKLRVRGFEILGRLVFNSGFSFTTNFTSMKSKDLGNTQNPYGETYGSKLNFILHYTHPKSRFWMTYHLRINGKQKDVVLENNPIGPNVPDFSVHSVSGGIALFPNSQKPIRLGIIVNNLFDKLYTEFSNASFFRPAPGRHIALTCSVGF